MGFTKLLLLALAIWIGWLAWRRLSVPESSNPPSKPVHAMVRCRHCGLHIPENEAIRDGGAVYCSEEHRRLGPPAAKR